MVTSNKLPDKKVVKMADQNSNAVVPQRTLLGEVNEHITCPLCRGYYIDATTIVECLHSFCRSCIIKHLQVKSYCPVCEMMINSAKPNIKLDKALQDIVYKLVPGLFQKEMERRQQFYASRPGPAASATPEQRGEDTERIIFSPEDVISFSLEYADVTDADSISSKSSDSNEPQPTSGAARRYLQCPAVVNISHLKKFLSMKFDIDSTQFAIDILYKRVPLSDYYTLMDIAYIYNWKRNEPMRFFYQIIDYVAIRNRLFDINRKGSHFRDRKASLTPTEDTNISSPTPNLNDQGSETSSGTDSPMPDDNSVKKISDTLKKADKSGHTLQNSNNTQDLAVNIQKVNCPLSPKEKKTDEDVEKSQFLNSFELTAKNNCLPLKSSPTKSNVEANVSNEAVTKSHNKEEPLKRKTQTPPNMPEMKKLKIEIEKAKIPDSLSNPIMGCSTLLSQSTKSTEVPIKPKEVDTQNKTSTVSNIHQRQSAAVPPKELKQQQTPIVKHQNSDSLGIKRNLAGSHNISSPKRKNSDTLSSVQLSSVSQKTVSPLKLHVPKSEAQSLNSKSTDILKAQSVKRIPDLKPTIPSSHQAPQNKGQPINKIRMDLLANNSDPTIDRSKILSQVKSSLNLQNTNQTSGDPLKSLFDSCKINIPSSLSITLTDQKLDTRNPNEAVNTDQKKNCVNKNTPNTNNTTTHKTSPPVHNFIEILKLPDGDTKKPQNKVEGNSDSKQTLPNKNEAVATQHKPTNKSSETSAKGPIPSLKPISDTKLVKQGANFTSPITFQQTFEQQLQSMQSDKKSKLPKNKAQVPKLMPACTSKAFTAACKLNNSGNKTNSTGMTSIENKSSTALDLSTPHNIQSQLGPQQTKAFETMQTIANLAKKQNLPSKGLPLALSQNNVFSNVSNRTLNTVPSPLRIPTASGVNQNNIDKDSPTGSQINNTQQELSSKANQLKQTTSASNTLPPSGYQIASHNSPSPVQPSPRSQTRSPSSSPKLVIAEEKQTTSSSVTEQNLNQSNQITSTQLPIMSASKNESPKASPGPSKSGLKPVKPVSQTGKITGIRQPITSSMKPNPTMNTTADYLSQPQFLSAHHALLRHQMEMHNAWFAMQNVNAQRQYDLFKNMSPISHQSQNDFNNKDKQ